MNHDIPDATPTERPASISQNETTPSTARLATASRSRTAKQVSLIASLLATLDTTLFVELAAIYYLDARLSTFLLRALLQVLILSPRVPSSFQPPTTIDPLNSPIIGVLFSTNFVCILAHLISDGPRAGEVTQFYNHGGIFVDFIGEKTPVSKLRLLLLDAVVFTLQLAMLSGMVEKSKLSKSQSSNTAGLDVENTQNVNPNGHQNLDAEERGVNAEVEDPFLSSSAPSSEEVGFTTSPHSHPLDSFTTGRHVVADLNLSATVRRQWRLWKQGPPTSSTGSSSTGANSTENAGANNFATLIGPFGLRVRVGGRVVGS